MYFNCRGYSSKSISINHIAAMKKCNLILLGETFLKKSATVSIPGYKTFNRNRAGKSGGGVSTCVSEEDEESTLRIKAVKKET